MTSSFVTVVGYDSNNIPRTYGSRTSVAAARAIAITDAQRLIAENPSLGGLSRWTFKIQGQDA